MFPAEAVTITVPAPPGEQIIGKVKEFQVPAQAKPLLAICRMVGSLEFQVKVTPETIAPFDALACAANPSNVPISRDCVVPGLTATVAVTGRGVLFLPQPVAAESRAIRRIASETQ